jgi:uncharacterized protein YprB with RNaseH-like and TPR domain
MKRESASTFGTIKTIINQNKRMKINWEAYKDEILSYKAEGKSSVEIKDIFVRKYGNVFFNKDRGIRNALSRWLDVSETKSYQKEPRVLFFDIETAPIKAYVWGKWQQNVNDDFIIQDWFILCWSAKWMFEDEIYHSALTKKEIKKGDDKRVVKNLWKMFDEADVIIAHNGVRFDNKKAKTRFMKFDLGLPRPYQIVDTLLHLRKAGAITSNRLDYVAKRFLGIDGKMDTPKGLWIDVLNCEENAMETMVAYCDVDVKVLEDVYFYFRKYFQPHINLSLFMEDVSAPKCPTCGSTHLEEYGEYSTTVSVYQSYKCNDCGSLSRARKGKLDREHTQSILSALPK